LTKATVRICNTEFIIHLNLQLNALLESRDCVVVTGLKSIPLTKHVQYRRNIAPLSELTAESEAFLQR
jgi:hypothetical protein